MGNIPPETQKSSETPSLKGMLALPIDCFIESYVSPPSTRRPCVFPHLKHHI